MYQNGSSIVYLWMLLVWRPIDFFASREVEVKVVKLSSVSTGQLRRLLALHSRPIDLVVFQGTLGQLSNET